MSNDTIQVGFYSDTMYGTKWMQANVMAFELDMMKCQVANLIDGFGIFRPRFGYNCSDKEAATDNTGNKDAAFAFLAAIITACAAMNAATSFRLLTSSNRRPEATNHHHKLRIDREGGLLSPTNSFHITGPHTEDWNTHTKKVVFQAKRETAVLRAGSPFFRMPMPELRTEIIASVFAVFLTHNANLVRINVI